MHTNLELPLDGGFISGARIEIIDGARHRRCRPKSKSGVVRFVSGEKRPKTYVKRARRGKQLVLGRELKAVCEFGGARLKKSHPTGKRPIAIKQSMHLVMRSSKARGSLSLRFNKARVQQIHRVVKKQAAKFGVDIHRYANVGNHLHMLVKACDRSGFIAFLRTISGLIARIALGAEKGRGVLNGESFWDQRPWTRVLMAWTDFMNVRRYVDQNHNEATGIVPYTPRKRQFSTA